MAHNTLDHVLTFERKVWLLKLSFKDLYCESEEGRIFQRDSKGQWYSVQGIVQIRIYYDELSFYLERLCTEAVSRFSCYASRLRETLKRVPASINRDTTPLNWRNVPAPETQSLVPFKVLIPKLGSWKYGRDQGRGFYCSRPTGPVYYRLYPGAWCYFKNRTSSYVEINLEDPLRDQLEAVFKKAAPDLLPRTKHFKRVDEVVETKFSESSEVSDGRTTPENKLIVNSKKSDEQAIGAGECALQPLKGDTDKARSWYEEAIQDFIPLLEFNRTELNVDYCFKSEESNLATVIVLRCNESRTRVLTCVANRRKNESDPRHPLLKYYSLHLIFRFSVTGDIDNLLREVLGGTISIKSNCVGAFVFSVVVAAIRTKFRSSTRVAIFDNDEAKDPEFLCFVVFLKDYKQPVISYRYVSFKKGKKQFKEAYLKANEIYQTARLMVHRVNNLSKLIEQPVVRILTQS